jgi:glutathione S-transferase
MTIEIYAFRWVPPFAQGFVRDLRIRWALEEAGLPYEVRLVGLNDRNAPEYRVLQPFGQIPAYRDDEVEMFESGAVVLRLMEKSEALAPRDVAGRARAASWVVAALNSVEPFMIEVQGCEGGLERGEAWAEARMPAARERLEQRLAGVSAWLGDRDYLEDRFTAGDLMMTCVFRELVENGVIARFPNLDALRARCEARPAFQRALEAQLAVFRAHEPDPGRPLPEGEGGAREAGG